MSSAAAALPRATQRTMPGSGAGPLLSSPDTARDTTACGSGGRDLTYPGSMLMALAILLVVAPVVEIYVMVQVAQTVGVLEMLLLMVLLCVAGAWVLRVETFESLRKVRRSVSAGRMPTAELLDAFLVFIAGVLLVLPGFVSASVGLLLVLPPVRGLARRALQRSIEAGVGRRVRISGFSAGPGPRQRRRAPSGPRYDSTEGGGDAGERGDGSDDIIDLEGEEIWLVDVRGEIEPPRPSVEPDPSQDTGLR